MGAFARMQHKTFIHFSAQHLIDHLPIILRYDEQEIIPAKFGIYPVKLRDLFCFLEIEGIGLESEYPYVGRRNPTPPQAPVQRYRIDKGHRVNAEDVLDYLAKHPLVADIFLYDSFWKQQGKGVYLGKSSDNDKELGLHAVVILAALDTEGRGVYRLRNSWGRTFGIEGDCLVTRDQLRDFWYPGRINLVEGEENAEVDTEGMDDEGTDLDDDETNDRDEDSHSSKRKRSPEKISSEEGQSSKREKSQQSQHSSATMGLYMSLRDGSVNLPNNSTRQHSETTNGNIQLALGTDTSIGVYWQKKDQKMSAAGDIKIGPGAFGVTAHYTDHFSNSHGRIAGNFGSGALVDGGRKIFNFSTLHMLYMIGIQERQDWFHLSTMSEGNSRPSPASLKPKKLHKRYRTSTIMSVKESAQDILEALDEGTETIHGLKLCMMDLVNENDREGNWKLLGHSRRAISNKMKGLKNLKMRIERRIEVKKMKLKVVEHDKENKGEGGGDIVDDASRLGADLEEDKGVAKGVDGDNDKYSTEAEEAAIRRMRQYVKEDDYTHLTCIGNKDNFRKWVKYYKQVGESKGFDVFEYPGPSLVNGTIVPLSIDEGTDFCFKLSNLAASALDGVNSSEEASYVFHKLVRANSQFVGGIKYCITFEGRNSLSGDAIETFQAKIVCLGKTSEVLFCDRRKDPSV